MKKIAEIKIRDIKLNLEPYKFKLKCMLILFNIITLIAVFYSVFALNHWIVWIIDLTIIMLVAIASYITYIQSKDFRYYTLFNNAIVINTSFIYAEIDISKLLSITKKRTLLDKLLKRPANSLEIKLINGACYDITYLNEDLDNLIKEIYTISKNLQK